MGLVYFCEGPDGGPVAVKVIHPHIAAVPGTAEALLGEAFYWLSLSSHPNIVQVLSAHSRRYEPAVIRAEFVSSSLREEIGSPLTLERLVRLTDDAVAALQFAQEQLPGFVHGDLKPENILVEEGVAKLADFGLARSAEASTAPSPIDSQQHAESTDLSVRGTPAYVPPEQIINGTSSGAGDVYSLGCVLFEAATARLVYGRANSSSEYLLRHLHHPPPDLAALRPDLPVEYRRLVLACLNKQPDLRPGLLELAEAVARIANMNNIRLNGHTSKSDSPTYRVSAARGLKGIGRAREALVLLHGLAAGTESRDEDQLGVVTLEVSILNDLGRSEEGNNLLQRVAARVVESKDNILKMDYYTEAGRVAAGLREDPNVVIENFARAAKALPSSSKVWANLAMAWEKAGDRERAVSNLHKAFSIAADLAYIVQLVNWLSVEPLDGYNAVAYAEVGVQKHGDNPLAYGARAFASVLNIIRMGARPDAPSWEQLASDYAVARAGGVSADYLQGIFDLMRSVADRHSLPIGN